MSSTPETPADASAKSLEFLSVDIAGDLSFCRIVYPEDNSSVAEIVAAMKEDGDFLNPLLAFGTLMQAQGTKHVILARYETAEVYDEPVGEILEVTAQFEDGSSENVTI